MSKDQSAPSLASTLHVGPIPESRESIREGKRKAVPTQSYTDDPRPSLSRTSVSRETGVQTDDTPPPLPAVELDTPPRAETPPPLPPVKTLTPEARPTNPSPWSYTVQARHDAEGKPIRRPAAPTRPIPQLPESESLRSRDMEESRPSTVEGPIEASVTSLRSMSDRAPTPQTGEESEQRHSGREPRRGEFAGEIVVCITLLTKGQWIGYYRLYSK